MRIRRKFALIISGIILFFFLFLYIVINHALPNEKPKNIFDIENKLKELQNGLHLHAAAVSEIKKQINTIQTNKGNPENSQGQLDTRELVKDSIIKADRWSPRGENQDCSFKAGVIPQPNIQMLNIYKELSFDNPDGGPWKQGWRIEYNLHDWNSHHKLKVFIVPHSHNDPGWIKTFDIYYEYDTKPILTNMLRHLEENEKMTFIWAEISYFARWYEHLADEGKKKVKRIVERKQLEFVTGGWVMNDEANSHWLSILQQLTEGQKWLKIHLNVTPVTSWAIDPFGHSSTMPLLLKGSGIKNLLIQRTHYSIKKYLAQNKELEFRWRQLWDTNGDTELFTHLMPFYSYDVPHTCGPDPKICCQFDFKRLPGYGLSCPWRIAPQPIDELNVAKRAELIVDQWRKKSVLYKTRSVLIPLGDDFRYSQSTEWDAQRINFEKLFDYINNEPSLNVEVKFGTLQEYFNSVQNEKKKIEFPSLSGDFFTYADKDDNYWSGYYTSRPYHKRVDRVLMNFLRSAEMLHAWSTWESGSGLDKLLEEARQSLSLFQHHDGITGTAKDHVVKDYEIRMIKALKASKFVIQQSVYKLLTKASIYQPDFNFNYFSSVDSRSPNLDENLPTIIIGEEISFKYVVIHNSLPQNREEFVEFFVARPFIMVTDTEKNIIPCQVTPVWSWNKGMVNTFGPQASTTKYRVIFKASLPPMGLKVYVIRATVSMESSRGTSFAKITVLTQSPFSISLGEYPYQVEFAIPRDTTIYTETGNGVSFNKQGLIKSMSFDRNTPTFPVHLEFLKYGVRIGPDRSGAYLFMPDGPATPLALGNPTILISKGPLESSVSTGLPFAIHENILRDDGLEIRNLIDIGDMGNTEIIMRISTGIQSSEVFYTDLNGLQFIKRQRFNKLPLQANYYPIPVGIFIEDDTTRLTLLTAQPLGGSSLASGQFEIMQDRRLIQDDNRGLGQGILDNQPTLHIFKLLIENRESCTKLDHDYQGGFLTVNAHTQMQSLLYPMEKLIFHENEWIGMIPIFGENHESLENSMNVAVFRDLPHIHTNKAKELKSALGLVLHRSHFEDCSMDNNGEGIINIKKMLGLDDDKEIFSSSLTLLAKDIMLPSDEIEFCPMDVKAFIINR